MRPRVKKRIIIPNLFTKRITYFILILVLFALSSPLNLSAEYIYERVILDENYRNDKSMTLTEVQDFLNSKGSWLADFSIPANENIPYPSLEDGEVIKKYTNSVQKDMEGISIAGQKVPDMIYNLGKKYNINPQVVMVMIQKESSAITQSTPSSESRRYWTMFYGYNETIEACRNCIEGSPEWSSNCTDQAYLEEKCGEPDYWKTRAEDYGGTGKQIARAIWYLDSRFENAQNPGSWYYYKDPVNIDGVNVTCENPSTRVLYLYTPHKQTNFFNIYTSYWGLEPNVMQANDTFTLEKRTYNSQYVVSSHKSIEAQAFYQDELIANYGPDKWEATIKELELGTNQTEILFKELDGKEELKKIILHRHKLGDIDGDNLIDMEDLALIEFNWGRTDPIEYMTDLNGDKKVDLTDLSIVAGNWGANQ